MENLDFNFRPEFIERFSPQFGDTLESVIDFLRKHERSYYLHVHWTVYDIPILLVCGYYRRRNEM